jgi:trimeric autotransporter adhesin
MPISSPSEFPPHSSSDQVRGIDTGSPAATGSPLFLIGKNAGVNSTVNSLVVIGSTSVSGGLKTAALAGSIVVGHSSLPVWTANAGGDAETPAALTAIGYQVAPLLQQADSSVLIGSAMLNSYNGTQNGANGGMHGMVIIGNGTLTAAGLATAADISDSVIIGHKCLISVANAFTNLVAIGYNVLNGGTVTGQDNVVIGKNAGSSLGSGGGAPSQNVIIGSQATTSGTGATSVVIGYNANSLLNASNNVLIGANAVSNGADTTAIGASANVNSGGHEGGARSIVIGAFAGRSLTGSGLADLFLIETNDAGVSQNAIFYGILGNATSCLIIGGSTDASGNRDLSTLMGNGATNILKLVNGSKATVNNTGGGYFYVNAGALHWVGSSGTDTALAVA